MSNILFDHVWKNLSLGSRKTMNLARAASLCAILSFVSFFASNSQAQIASDTAGNYSGAWNNGANGGTGFGPWSITSTNGSINGTNFYSGHFVGNPTNAGITGFGTQAFCLYANPAGTPASVWVDRSLSNALSFGQTLEFKWAVNYDSGTGNKGFNLYAGSPGTSEIVNVNQSVYPGNITLNGVNAITNYGTGPMTWKFTLINSNTLRITSSPRDGSTNIAFSTNLPVSGAPKSFRFYATALGNGDNGQPYFNDFAVTAAASADVDADGMPDWWELGYFGTLDQVANGDVDNDGLTNLAEYTAGTLPNVADTDGDGMKDGFEVATNGYQVILGSFTWNVARLHAIAKGGNLATITSAVEKTNIATAVGTSEMNDLWLGGYQSNGTWKWVTGETWDYTNWNGGVPSNDPTQDYLRLESFSNGWDNWFSTPTYGAFPVAIRGYLLEKANRTDPTKFNYPLITVAGSFQSQAFRAEPYPTNAPVNVMTAGTDTNQFVRTLDFNFPITAQYLGKFANGEPFSSSNNINWGTSGTSGVAQRGGVGNDIPLNVTSTGWWTFTFNTDTLSYSFARKVFSSYLEYAAAYNLPADGLGGGQSEDYDGDGLTNGQEYAANTSPTSTDTDEDTVPDAYEVNTSTTSPLLADTDGDTLPDWWELTVGLNPLVASGGEGSLGDPDGDGFNNRQEFEGQSNPLSAASVPANRNVTFSLDLSRQISSGAFLTNSQTVQVWGTFNDWGNFTNKFSLTNNGSGIYTGTYPVAGARGATNKFKFVTLGTNDFNWEAGSDRFLVMGSNGAATNLPTAYLGEVRPVTFSVNMGVQRLLGRFTPGTDKVYLLGDVVGSWSAPGTELRQEGTSDVYSGQVFVSGQQNATNNIYKFSINNSLGFEADPARRLTLGVRDAVQTVTEAYFNNVNAVPASSREVTFAVDMGAQIFKGTFNPALNGVQVRGIGSFNESDARLLIREGTNSSVYSRKVTVEGPEGGTLEYKFYATGTNGLAWEASVPTPNTNGNRTLVLAATNLPQNPGTNFFAGLEQSRMLTLQVDMSNQITKGNFNPASNSVFVSGSFNSYSSTANPLNPVPGVGSNVYAVTLFLDGPQTNNLQYKFFNNSTRAPNFGYEISRGNSNRILTVAQLGTNFSQITNAPVLFSNDDGVGPGLILNGDATVNLKVGDTFTDPGATATDDQDGSCTVEVSGGPVTTSAPGTFNLSYTAFDVSGNASVPSSVTRTVIVAAAGDTTPPVITRTGSETSTVAWGSSYSDAGATATDNKDTSVTVNSSGSVNTAVPGTYTITYTASDAAGNAATPVTRTVTVSTPSNTPGADGISGLLRYAFGANGPTDSVTKPTASVSGGNLVLTAIVRTNQTNPSLMVVGQWVTNVSQFTNTSVVTSNTISGSTNGVSQTNVPAGCERQTFSVPQGSDTRKFLRLKVEM